MPKPIKIAVRPDKFMADLFVNTRLTVPAKELVVTAARSSGPGGQNVNKVNSKVTLRWNPSRCTALTNAWRARFVARHAGRINRQGELVLHSERFRDQSRNLSEVRQKLVEMLLECQSAPKRRKPTRPTLGSKQRRLDSKRRRSEKKQNRGKSWGKE
jgi:ribosome-associated protein